jgi:hypothetical protein
MSIILKKSLFCFVEQLTIIGPLFTTDLLLSKFWTHVWVGFAHVTPKGLSFLKEFLFANMTNELFDSINDDKFLI